MRIHYNGHMQEKHVTFITGNQHKADQLALYLGFPVDHVKLDLDEIQSLDLREIIEHKVRHAYEKIHTSVLVEDVSLEFEALGGLPGPFIRFFVDAVPLETMCRMIDGQTRKAVARCAYGYYNGTTVQIFEGELEGEIAETPAGKSGYGWDALFIPSGYHMTRAEMSKKDYKKTYLQLKPLASLTSFFENLS